MMSDPVSKRSHGAFLAGILLSALTTACNALYPVGEAQCSVDADCTARGAAFAGTACVDEVCQARSTADAGAAGPWDCLGHVAWPSSGPATYTVHVRVVDVLTSAPPEGATVRVCSKLDVPCDKPLATSASVDDAGIVTASVAAGFDGYLEITGADLTPALFFVTRPVYADVDVPGVVPMVSPAGFENIAKAIGASIDPESGHIYALASTCLDAPASGVRIELDKQGASTAGYYMVNNAPVGTATSTDAAGSGGFLDVPEGFAKVSAFVAASGARIGESSVVIRKGTVSYPRLVPAP